jgi:3-hydroxybutyryl-CoA dehydrogenase
MSKIIGVIGAGTMGSGIAQVAAQCGHSVYLMDANVEQLERAKTGVSKSMDKLVVKGKFTVDQKSNIESNIHYVAGLEALSPCDLIIEAIVEKMEVKHAVFSALEKIVSSECILASNTSSLSIASIGSSLEKADRVIGIHFFNPATIMPLVEIIPAVQTNESTINEVLTLIESWGKTVVVCKDTPGFIVNRVARPFYGEALRIYEEGLADFATIDWAMTHFGGFKMGPFTLMDYIGNDVNYAVTESVFQAFYFDPRFKPSFTQKRHSEAGFYGRKTGRGFYQYAEGIETIEPIKDEIIGKIIFERVLVMLINEAVDAVFMQVASVKDVDLAMTKGVNYPKGLLAWADELGLNWVLDKLSNLFDEYGEDRYRPNALLKRMVKNGNKFY